MFFIFGFGPKTKVIEKKLFLCPVCRIHTSYEFKHCTNAVFIFDKGMSGIKNKEK